MSIYEIDQPASDKSIPQFLFFKLNYRNESAFEDVLMGYTCMDPHLLYLYTNKESDSRAFLLSLPIMASVNANHS